jgi:hypothetical protein
MTTIERVLENLAASFVAGGRRFALVGGWAVCARAEPRFTRDVDCVVAVEGDRDAEAVVHALSAAGYSVVSTVEREESGRLAAVRLLPPSKLSQGVVVDLLFASSGIEAEVALAAEGFEVRAGLSLPIASLGHLIALKVLSEAPDRPQDVADLRALAEAGAPDDLQLAQRALALIEARGFARGKHLGDAYRRLVGAMTPSPLRSAAVATTA